MKKVLVSILVVVGAFFAITVGANAAPNEAAPKKAEPFEGTFHGRVKGDNGSSAPISLVLNQKGKKVEGTVFLGEGLYVDAGICGAATVPAVTQSAAGQTSAKNPRHLSAQSAFKVSGLNVKLKLDGDLSADGETLKAKAKIDLPWICGGDPIISGTLVQA